MESILAIHGFVRWLAALAALAAIIKFGSGLVRKDAYSGMDRGLMSAYTGILDLNLLLGLIMLLFDGKGFNGTRIEHATTMIIAIALAHSSAAWKKSDDANKKFRNNLIVVVLSIVFVFAGVLRLRGGWF